MNRNTIETMLLDCGMDCKLKGFTFIVDAVEAMDCNDNVPFSRIYKIVAQKRNTTPKNVEHSINYALISTRTDVWDYDKAVRYIGMHKETVATSLSMLHRNAKLSVF